MSNLTLTLGWSWQSFYTIRTRWFTPGVPHCKWSGISCNALGNVTRIALAFTGLKGTLPSSVATLAELYALDLQLNALVGTLPPGLGKLRKLKTLELARNGFTGTLPSLAECKELLFLSFEYNMIGGTLPEFQNNPRLRELKVTSNRLHGTIPPKLWRLKHLAQVTVSFNQFTGTLDGIANAKWLYSLQAEGMDLNGTLPAGMCNTSMEYLQLSDNSFHGPFPECYGSLTNMKVLALANNSIRGTIPEAFGNWEHLIQLNLGQNALHGSIPQNITKLRKLVYLGLNSNRLSSTIPATLFSQLPKLTTVLMHSNLLSGRIPSFNTPKLRILLLSNNLLTGPVPWASLFAERPVPTVQTFSWHGKTIINNCSVYDPNTDSAQYDTCCDNIYFINDQNAACIQAGQLASGAYLEHAVDSVGLSGNRLNGALPRSIPRTVQHFMIDTNSFTGQLPDFSHNVDLKTLVVHANKFGGQLHLPVDRNTSVNTSLELSTLYTHNNRLSCPIVASPGGYKSTLKTLVLTGNYFTGPIPNWLPMSTAHSLFLDPDSDLEMLLVSLGLAALGLALLLALSAAVHGSQWKSFFWFSSTPGLQQFEFYCFKVLAALSVPYIAGLLPIFLAGANFYECGGWWLSTTSSYLSDAPSLEWLAAGCACFAAAGCSIAIEFLHHHAIAQYPEQSTTRHSWSSLAMLWALWGVLLLFLSIPPGIYALTSSIPDDNTLHLNGSLVVLLFHNFAGVLLFIIVVVICPPVAQSITRCVLGCHDSWISCKMLLIARLITGPKARQSDSDFIIISGLTN